MQHCPDLADYAQFLRLIDEAMVCKPEAPLTWAIQEADHQLKLEDGSLRIFLNTATEELNNLDQKLKAFYHYIQKGVVESELAQNISHNHIASKFQNGDSHLSMSGDPNSSTRESFKGSRERF